jgi:dUTP pyrophosphatase
MVRVKVRRLQHAFDLSLPAYQSAGAAGADLCAAEACTIGPGQRRAVASGLMLEIPAGYEGQVRPRSGLALRHGLTVVNAPGTIDSDYRGEVKVLLVNLGSEAVTIGRGDRIAQLVISPVTRAAFDDDPKLSNSARGAGGFGSTGR